MNIKDRGSQRGSLRKTKVLEMLISKDLNYYFVEHSGLEPLTSTLPVSRSSQMS